MAPRWSSLIAGVGLILLSALPAGGQQPAPAPQAAAAPKGQQPAVTPPEQQSDAAQGGQPGDAPEDWQQDDGQAVQRMLHERIGILEAEYSLLQSEINLLRERLNALLGPPAQERIHDLSVGESPVRGLLEAPITLIEFGDFQSDYSARAAHVVERLLTEFPENLRFVFKHFPLASLHPQANEAALAALAAEKQDSTWEMHDLLFRNNRRLQPNLYLLLAQQLGLDLPLFDQDRRALWALERLSRDEKTAERVEVRGVPAFFLNGRRMRNWRYSFLKARIEELIPPPADEGSSPGADGRPPAAAR